MKRAAKEVTDFIAAIEERMHGMIRQTERTVSTRAPQFAGFAIK